MGKEAARHSEGEIYLFVDAEAEAAMELASPDEVWGSALGEKITRLGARAAIGHKLYGMRVIWGQSEFRAKRGVSRDEEDRYWKQVTEAQRRNTDGSV